MSCDLTKEIYKSFFEWTELEIQKERLNTLLVIIVTLLVIIVTLLVVIVTLLVVIVTLL